MVKKKINFDVRRYKSIFIYVIFIIFMVIVIINKKNLHTDEIYSYTLANNVGSISINFDEGHTYSPVEGIYLNNISVSDSSKQFNLKNVWKNQTNDVHPPLYYLILHIICSFSVGKFSIWQAGIINICFALLSLYIFRKLISLISGDKVIADFASLLFILSTGILQNVSFFRMYVMAMFWVTLIAYFFLKAFGEIFSWKLWGKITFVAVAGALTHYYCIIYLCATCLVFVFCLLIQKRWRDIILWSISMIIAAALSVMIFPAMLVHMFSGYRGTESMNNLVGLTWDEHWERLKGYGEFINTQMFGKIGWGGVVFVCLIVILFFVIKKNEGEVCFILKKITIMKWIIFGIPSVIYLLFVSSSAGYVTDRYLFPIYAVAFAFFLCVMNDFCQKLLENQYMYIVMCLIGMLFIVNGFGNAKWDYLYKNTVDLLNKARNYTDRNCISVYNEKWRENSSYYEVRNYKSMTFIRQENIDSIRQHEDLFGDEFILRITGGNDEKIISLVQKKYPYLSRYEKIGGYAYSTTYRLYAGEKSRKVHIFNYDKSGGIGVHESAKESNASVMQGGQEVWIVEQSDGYGLIELGGQVLDIKAGSFEEGTNVQFYILNGSDAQKWKMIENKDKSFCFLAKDERFALTCGENGNVYLSEYKQGDANQCWWVE